MRWAEERRQVVEISRKMVEKGLVVGTAGNVSLRLKDPSGLIAITPSGRYYDLLNEEDIVVVDFEGGVVDGRLAPSIETMLHIGIYKARPKINAIIHTHSVFASILAVAGSEIPPILDEQIISIGGEIKVAPYALPGSKELASNVVATLGNRNAVLLANHGVVAVGRELREAFTIAEMVEKTAKIYFGALLLGKVNLIPSEAVSAEKALFALIWGEESL